MMGEYLPPPLGLLTLAAFLEDKKENLEIEVRDCQAEKVDWKGLKERISSFLPDIVAPSALSTCNAYTTARACELAKKIDPEIKTVVGGQHFSATAQESLQIYPEIDFIIRGEGEQSFYELIRGIEKSENLTNVKGISYRKDGMIIHNQARPFINNLDELPFPGYNFIEKNLN